MTLVMKLDDNEVFVTEDIRKMQEEVAARAYGVAKARTAERMTVIDEATGEVIYSYTCDDHSFSSSAWVQRFVDSFGKLVYP